MESVKLRVIKMHSWILQALQLLHVDFTAFQTYVFYRLTGLQKQTEKERHFIEREQEIAGEREEVGRRRVRRFAEWKAVLTVDCLFGDENEHPETWNLRFEMNHLRGRELTI